MKKMNVLAAVAVVLAAAAVAGAQEIKVDFDGAKKAAPAFAEMLKASQEQAGAEVAAPVNAAPARAAVFGKNTKITVIMRNGADVKREEISCEGRNGKAEPEACRKQSDSARLTRGDVEALSLRSYFPEQKPSFASLLQQTKHSYTNQSGPQTFHCEDSCADYALDEFSIGTDGVSGTWVCKSWTHECDCVAGCY